MSEIKVQAPRGCGGDLASILIIIAAIFVLYWVDGRRALVIDRQGDTTRIYMETINDEG